MAVAVAVAGGGGGSCYSGLSTGRQCSPKLAGCSSRASTLPGVSFGAPSAPFCHSCQSYNTHATKEFSRRDQERQVLMYKGTELSPGCSPCQQQSSGCGGGGFSGPPPGRTVHCCGGL